MAPRGAASAAGDGWPRAGGGFSWVSRKRASERGMVTAETIVVMPFVVTVALVLTWFVGLGVTQVRLADAAAAGARAAARGDAPERVRALVRDRAPQRSRVQIVRRDDEVTVVVRVDARVPLLSGAGRVRLHRQATALREDRSAAQEARG